MVLIHVVIIVFFYSLLLYTRKPPPPTLPPKTSVQSTYPVYKNYIERVFSQDNLASDIYKNVFEYATPWIGNADFQNGKLI